MDCRIVLERITLLSSSNQFSACHSNHWFVSPCLSFTVAEVFFFFPNIARNVPRIGDFPEMLLETALGSNNQERLRLSQSRCSANIDHCVLLVR